MEHVVSTTSMVFPTTCRNYYDPYQQKSMAPSTKTYTISNSNNRRSKKIDGLNLVRSGLPDFRSNPPVVAVPHRLRTPASTPAVKTTSELESVSVVPHRLRQPASTPAVKTSPEREPVPITPKILRQPASAPATKPVPERELAPAVPHRLRQPASSPTVKTVLAQEVVPTAAPVNDPKSIPRPSNKPSIRQTPPPPPPPTPRSSTKPRIRQAPPPPPPPTPITRSSDRSGIKQVPPPPPSPRLKPAPKQAPKPLAKPAPALLTQTQPPRSRYEHRHELPLPTRDDLAPEYSPTDPGILDRDSSIRPARPVPRPIPRTNRPRSKERQREKRPSTPPSKPQSASLFSFACFRPRQKSGEKPTPSFKVLNSKLSDYETGPTPIPSRAKKSQIPSQDTPVVRYKFLYPKIPDNIPGTAGINSIPNAKLPKSKYQQPQGQQQQQSPQVVPLPPRRVVKKLSSHLSHHPAVKSLVYQYPAVEMYEKRTGFDSYFDSPFVEYSHSYWTAALHRPPSPFKKTKPLKVKFETPASPMSRYSSIETHGGKADLGARCQLRDSYSYPYSPEDYYRKSDVGPDRPARLFEQTHRAVKPQSGESLVLLASSNGRNTWMSCKSG